MLIQPITVEERYPIGSIVDAYASPGDNWMLCNGQLLEQASYPTLYAIMVQPHPPFQNWEVIEQDFNGVGLNRVIKGSSNWIGASDNGSMFYSSDGENWTESTLATYTDNFIGLAYDGTTLVSVSDANSAAYITSTDDGVNWTERSFAAAVNGYEVTHDGTNFYVASYYNSGVCYYSSSGTSWTSGTTMKNLPFLGMAASSNVFVTVGYSSGYTAVVAVSTDSMSTWKYYPAPFNSPRHISYDSVDDLFIMTCYSNYPLIYATSPGDDGVNWTVYTLSVGTAGPYTMENSYSKSMHILKKVGDYYFALVQYSNILSYSTDLKNWHHTTLIAQGHWRDAYYISSSGTYYIVGLKNYFVKCDMSVLYNDTTYFKLPMANRNNIGKAMLNKYIRVS